MLQRAVYKWARLITNCYSASSSDYHKNIIRFNEASVDPAGSSEEQEDPNGSWEVTVT
jgi:hypothetical protein